MIFGDIATVVSLGLAIVGQLLNAGTVLIDKHIVTNTSVTRPGVYVFYVGLMSGVVILLLPFGIVGFPDLYTILLSLDIGFVFIGSILFLYRALKHANATDVIAWLTAFSAITTFIFSALFLSEKLPHSFFFAMVFFVIGILLVGHFRFYARSFIQVIGSGILFGLSVVLMKMLFIHAPFVDAFFWSRIGNVVAALFLLLFPSVRTHLFQITKSTTRKTGALIVGNRVLGGAAFLCILSAVKLGSASIVNALSALQFVFIFVMIYLFRGKLSELYHHEFRPGHVLHKVMAMIFITIGFFVLFI